jgi:ABC-type sugar transport system ATPase subunit
MEDKKVINSIAAMELQMLGIAYKLKQNQNVSEPTSAIVVLARKCKGAAMTMNIRNNAALQEMDRLKNENKVLKGKLDHSQKDKAKALHESGSLQFKVVHLEGEILNLNGKINNLFKKNIIFYLYNPLIQRNRMRMIYRINSGYDSNYI